MKELTNPDYNTVHTGYLLEAMAEIVTLFISEPMDKEKSDC